MHNFNQHSIINHLCYWLSISSNPYVETFPTLHYYSNFDCSVPDNLCDSYGWVVNETLRIRFVKLRVRFSLIMLEKAWNYVTILFKKGECPFVCIVLVNVTVFGCYFIYAPQLPPMGNNNLYWPYVA